MWRRTSLILLTGLVVAATDGSPPPAPAAPSPQPSPPRQPRSPEPRTVAAPATPSSSPANAAPVIAQVRAAYAALPTLSSRLLYILNSGHKDYTGGTLGMGSQTVDADRSTGRIHVPALGDGEFTIVTEGSSLRIVNSLLPDVDLLLPRPKPLSAKPAVEAMRAVSQEGLVPAPWLYFELSLYLDGELGMPVRLDAFRIPREEDVEMVGRMRQVEQHRLLNPGGTGPTPWTILVAGIGDGTFGLGVDSASGRIRSLVYVGNGRQVGLPDARLELIIAPNDREAEGASAAPSCGAPSRGSETLRDAAAFAARVRDAYIARQVPDIADARRRLAELEREISSLPPTDVSRTMAEEQAALLKRLIAAAEAAAKR